MATTLYLVTSTSTQPWPAGGTHWFSMRDASRGVTPGDALFEGSQVVALLSTSVATGAGSTDNSTSVTGATAGRLLDSGRIWLSNPLAADVTISSSVSFNIYAHESSMNANATIRVALYRVDEQGALTAIVDSSFGTEVGTAKALKTWSATPTSTNMKRGDRLLSLLLWDDATALTMASGFTLTVTWNGTNAAAEDSRITLTENLTFLTSDPSGTSYYLRDTASDISSGKVLSQTQGSGTATAVHTTIAGPITFPGDQWTATAGGSDIEWFTPALNAFTLQDIVLAELRNNGERLEQAVSPLDSLTVELAVVDADGSNPVIWARSYTSMSDTADPKKHWLTGPALSVAQGKRLRLRFYSDDFRPVGNQVSGTNRTIRYDGTSTYATRLVFTQTITEETAGDALLAVKSETAEADEVEQFLRGLIRVKTETGETSELASRLLGLVRLRTETAQAPETVLHAGAYIRTQTETVQLSETALRLLGLVRTRAESAEVAEAQAAFRGLTRLRDEVAEASELTQSVRGLVRAQGEAVEAAETVAALRALARARTETAEVAESISRLLALVRARAETVEAGETALRTLGLARVRAETAEVAETRLSLRGIMRLQSEAVDVAESVAGLLGLVRMRAETVEAAETFAPYRALARLRDEVVEVAEAAARVMALIRTRAETVEVAEAPARVLTIVRWHSETAEASETHVSVLESIANALVAVRDEVAEVGEAFLRLLGLTRTRTDTAEVAESAARAMALQRMLSEGVDVSEAEARLLAMARQRTETAEASETRISVLEAIGNVLLAIRDEIVEAGEQALRLLGLTGVRSEVIGATEFTFRAMGLTRLRGEVVQVLETSLRSHSMVRLRDEIAEVSDVVVRSLGFVRVRGETVEVGEVVLPFRGLIFVHNETVEITEGVAGVIAAALFGFIFGALKLVPALAGRLGLKPGVGGRVRL